MDVIEQVPFSADVRLDLVVDGRELPLSQVGPDYAVLRDMEEVQAGKQAALVMHVDGREHRWEVVLIDGITPIDREFRYEVTRYPKRIEPLHPRLR